MKLIAIDGNQLSVSKLFIYLIIMAFLLGGTVVPKVWHALTYNKTVGVVSSITYREYQTSHGIRTNYYPVVDFLVNNEKLSCLGSKFEHDGTYVNDSLTVIYNPDNPRKAFVYNFLGYWAPDLVYLIPTCLILSLLLNIDSIPKVIIAKI